MVSPDGENELGGRKAVAIDISLIGIRKKYTINQPPSDAPVIARTH